MMRFLSELTYPIENELNGTYFYLFAGMPNHVNWDSHKVRILASVLRRTCVGRLAKP